jgi:sugar phosphate isomerase/epimerase
MSMDKNRNGDRPKLAMCNFITDPRRLKRIALEQGFDGIDWSFDLENLPTRPTDESRWVEFLTALEPLEVRFHCPFSKVDIGHENAAVGQAAMELFQRVTKLVAKANGKFLTLHIGLGHDTTVILSWNDTIMNLRNMVQYGAEKGVSVCLENLAWGWTSKPNLFEKLIRRTGAGVTFDIGHAQACEAVTSQQFDAEDFVTPHANRVFNAHVYNTEIPGVGHMPPRQLDDIKSRLDLLKRIDCSWWTLEIRDVEGLLQTKQIISAYFETKNS